MAATKTNTRQRSVQHNSKSEDRKLREILADDELTSAEAAYECFHSYARNRPGVVALWALGIGFVLGWKLRLW